MVEYYLFILINILLLCSNGMDMGNSIIGYVAASVTIGAFTVQFYHTLKSGTIAGLSLNRTILDAISLLLWVVYAIRIDDNPLLIATSCEAFTCLCVCLVILKHYVYKDGKGSVTSSPNQSPPLTPPSTPVRKDSLVESEAKYVIISIKPPIKIDTIVI
jgi:uncharacterized protein with PQ loop repeat